MMMMMMGISSILSSTCVYFLAMYLILILSLGEIIEAAEGNFLVKGLGGGVIATI